MTGIICCFYHFLVNSWIGTHRRRWLSLCIIRINDLLKKLRRPCNVLFDPDDPSTIHINMSASAVVMWPTVPPRKHSRPCSKTNDESIFLCHLSPTYRLGQYPKPRFIHIDSSIPLRAKYCWLVEVALY